MKKLIPLIILILSVQVFAGSPPYNLSIIPTGQEGQFKFEQDLMNSDIYGQMYNMMNLSTNQAVTGQKTFTQPIIDTSVNPSTFTALNVTTFTVTGASFGIWRVIYYGVNLSTVTTYTISGLNSSNVKQYRIRFNCRRGDGADSNLRMTWNNRGSGEYVLRGVGNLENIPSGYGATINQNDTNFFDIGYVYAWCQGEILIYPKSKYTSSKSFPTMQYWSTSSSNDGMYVYYTYSGGGFMRVYEDIVSVSFTASGNIGYGSEFTVEELR